MANLPVREMVLYKHGVGFFVRAGELIGEEVALTFGKDEINDVLKSLAVFDRAGGQVLGIHYQTPMDTDTRLKNTSVRLSADSSLKDLLRDLRGRQVSITLEVVAGSFEQITGRIVGVDDANNVPIRNVAISTVDPISTVLITMLAVDGQVRVFRLDTLRSFIIHDEQSDHDLSYFLDTSMSEDSRRTVNVRMTDGEHDLVVYYVAPSPTWRVSYRLVAETDMEAPETGKALLQGWGLFDNRLDEDLDNVRVSLVAGQPISFIYDLYASKIPTRPTVQDETRVAPGPIEYDGAVPLAYRNGDPTPTSESTVGFASFGSPREKRLGRAQSDMVLDAVQMQELGAPSRQEMQQSTPAQSETKDSGEFFQYDVTTPVSVKRGESALVPIISAEIDYQRELLYNKAKLADHPVAALRFNNTTGLTLERGPVTLVEDGDYKGEAVVAFTKETNQVYLPYAVELGVKITERPKQYTQTAGLSIKNDYLVFEEHYIEEITSIFENTTGKTLTVTLEAPIVSGLELFDTPAPNVQTASERRWQVEVPARAKAEFTRKDRRLTKRHEALRSLNYQNLESYLGNRWLDKSTFNNIKDMLDNLEIIAKAHTKIGDLINERKKIYEQQEQLRANLGALQSTGQEATLRNRLLGQLEQTQNRLEEIERQTVDLQKMIATTEEKVSQIIANLGKEPKAKPAPAPPAPEATVSETGADDNQTTAKTNQADIDTAETNQ